MTTINFVGAKGGVGTSTIAAATALLASERMTVDLQGDPGDLAAILGVTPSLNTAMVNQRLILNAWKTDSGAKQLTVRDLGTFQDLAAFQDLAEQGNTFIVMRGPDYLGLRRALEGMPKITTPNGVVLVAEEKRSLGASDIKAVLDVPVVATVPIDPAVARSIDSGLLSMSMHRLRSLAPLTSLYPAVRVPERSVDLGLDR